MDFLISSLTHSLSVIRKQWHPQLFPILWDYDSRGCYAVVGDSRQQEITPIVDIWFEDSYYGEYYIEFPSLTQMVQGEAECYESDIYTKNYKWEEGKAIRRKYQDQPLRVWRSPDFT